MNRWMRPINIYLGLSCLLLLCGAVTGAYLSEPSQEESIKYGIRNASTLMARVAYPALPGMSFAQGKGVDAILTSQGRPCTCRHTTTYHYHSSYHSSSSSSGSSMPAWMVWPLLGIVVLIGIVSWIVKLRRGGAADDDDCDDYTWRRESHASGSIFTASADTGWPSSSDSDNTNEGGGFFGADAPINWSDGDMSNNNGGGSF
ncbi:hypothetical protein Krac_10035 [Ktedonobacter racemifer DSM 44963]|uniref:Transmembrane protein n=2 Tax=Ktedonobacter racemifer TaxID=363277 RepID=D6TEW1_KTERA|nr:hypothetical protein Krac_10035 [Ktedonobacter racemifer DSM 44963]